MELNSIKTNETSAVRMNKPTRPQAPSRSYDLIGKKNGVNFQALRTLQLIIQDYKDTLILASDKRFELGSRLKSAGLLESGALVRTKA